MGEEEQMIRWRDYFQEVLNQHSNDIKHPPPETTAAEVLDGNINKSAPTKAETTRQSKC